MSKAGPVLEFPMRIISIKGHKGWLLTPQGRTRVEDGREFETVSAAASAVSGGANVSGWRFWKTTFNGTVYPLAALKVTFPGVLGRDAAGVVDDLSASFGQLDIGAAQVSAKDAREVWMGWVTRVVRLFARKNGENRLTKDARVKDVEGLSWTFWFERPVERLDVVLARLKLVSRTEVPPGMTFRPSVFGNQQSDNSVIVCTATADDVACTLGNGLDVDVAQGVSQSWQSDVLAKFAASVALLGVEASSDRMQTNRAGQTGRRKCVVVTARYKPFSKSDYESQDSHARIERASIRFAASHAECTYRRPELTTHQLRIVIAKK